MLFFEQTLFSSLLHKDVKEKKLNIFKFLNIFSIQSK